jgi:hypothetical protein
LLKEYAVAAPSPPEPMTTTSAFRIITPYSGNDAG